jgi:HAMP domain-containing protein
MQKKKKPKIRISNWEVVKIHWLAQASANLFFGLSLVLLTVSYAGFSWMAISKTAVLYVVIYAGVFLPLYGLIPLLIFRHPKNVLDRVNRKEKIKEEEIIKTVEELMDLPFRLAVIISITVWFGFGMGAFFLRQGLVADFMPLINLVVICCLLIGFGVGIIHAFLNYIFLENYLRPIINFLGSHIVGKNKKIKIRRWPLTLKVFLVVLLCVFASQISLWVLFSVKIGVASMEELKDGVFYAGIVIVMTLLYVFVIAVLFSQNFIYPLKKLIKWAEKVIKGQAAGKVTIITNDEILEAVEYLKKMVEELENTKATLEIKVESRTQELKKMTENLDKQVKQRTKELREKVEELERFQKLAVGRELKMVELKKEINLLKKQIENYES